MEFFAINAPCPTHWTLNSYFCAFCSAWLHLWSFHYCTKLGAKQAELLQLMQKFGRRSRIGHFCNEHTWSTPLALNSCFSEFRWVWVRLESFCYCKKHGAIWADLVQLVKKFVPQSRVGIFCNERTRSTPLDHNLRFWYVSWCLSAFWIVSLQHKTWCKLGWTGAVSAKVWTMKLRWNFSKWMHPVQSIGP